MRLALFAAIALVAIPLSGASQVPAEQELSWVESADPAKMFSDSTRRGHVHFLTVCGIACFEPGMGPLTFAHCYDGSATKLTIDPTGDVIRSKRHGELKEKLYRFAEVYNRLVREELDRTSGRHCLATERWDDYWLGLDSIARQIPAHPNESFVTATTGGLRDRPDFQLHVQDERDLSPEIYKRACALAPHYGIAGRVRFAVTTGNINDHPKQQPDFACAGGDVAS